MGDGGHGGLAGFSGREVAGFLGLAGAGAVGLLADPHVWVEDLEEEGGEGQVERRENAVTVSVAACRACGKLTCPGGIPRMSAPAPISCAVAW